MFTYDHLGIGMYEFVDVEIRSLNPKPTPIQHLQPRMAWQLRPKHHIFHHLAASMVAERYNCRFYHTYRDEASMQFAKRTQASFRDEGDVASLIQPLPGLGHGVATRYRVSSSGIAQQCKPDNLEETWLEKRYIKCPGRN